MPTIERGGALVWYGDSGSGTPVLLVHGGLFDPMDSTRFWQRPGVVDDLVAAGYRVLSVDRRYCGRTSAPYAAHSWHVEAEDLAAVLHDSAVEAAHVVAGSNGCSAAVRLALAAPGLVRSLILCWPATPDPQPLRAAFTRSAEAIETLGPLAYLEALRSHGVPRPEEPRPGFPFGFALLQDSRASAGFLTRTADEAAAIMRASATALLLAGAIRGLSDADAHLLGSYGMPISILPAEPEDRAHPRAVALALTAAIPGASLRQGFPPTPSPQFASARTFFSPALCALLASTAGSSTA